MTLRLFTTAEKLDLVEQMIGTLRVSAQTDADIERIHILKAIASDLRGRMTQAPSAALYQLERRLASVARSRTRLGHSQGALIGVAEELMGRWPTVKQALEKFGADLEQIY